MIIIIDAYNILKYIYAHEYITQRQRVDFIQQLVQYAKKKEHKLFIVFDGGSYGLPNKIVKKTVTVLYTGAQERADDCIVRLLDQYKNFETLVVSSDREITSRAERNNIAYIDGNLFYTFVGFVVRGAVLKSKKETRVHKLHEEVDPILDALMESVDVPVLTKTEKSVVVDRNSGKKLSKNERLLISLVEKL